MTDQELEVAGRVHAAIDELTRLGPGATARVLAWTFARYGICPTCAIKAIDVRERRHTPPVAPPPPLVEVLTNGHKADAPELPSKATEREIRGAQLRMARTAAGMTQNALALHLGGGMRQAEISNIELGRMVLTEDRWQLLFKAVEIAEKGEPTA